MSRKRKTKICLHVIKRQFKLKNIRKGSTRTAARGCSERALENDFEHRARVLAEAKLSEYTREHRLEWEPNGRLQTLRWVSTKRLSSGQRAPKNRLATLAVDQEKSEVRTLMN